MAEENLELATHLHVSVCPAANHLPACANMQQCSLSCVSLYVDHLEKCTRCVQHLCGNDADVHTIDACPNVHCRKVATCWHLKGDLIDCCFKHKLKFTGYVFENIVSQLQVFFKLDLENIAYRRQSEQSVHGRHSPEDEQEKQQEYTAQNTAMLFDFLRIFQTFKANMRSCNMTLDGGDLAGILQTMIQQLTTLPAPAVAPMEAL